MKRFIHLAALLGVLAVAACGSPASEPPFDAAAAARKAKIESADAECAGPNRKEKLVTLETPENEISVGYPIGSGDLGIVMLHEVDAGLCQWVPYAQELATTQGIRSIPVDIAGSGAWRYAVAAVTYLRNTGAKKVIIMGASRGALMAIQAATVAQPPVDGVISLSAPSVYSGVDGRAAAKKLTMPVIFAAGVREGGFTEDAKTLHGLCPSTNKSLVLPGTSVHGVELLDHIKEVLTVFYNNQAAALPAVQ